jgi:hypothetical protein
MKEIAEHVNTVFQALLHNYIDTNMKSIPCEISIFGYCPIENKHQLFHIKHEAKDESTSFSEFEFLGDDAIHLMGKHQKEIHQLILFQRECILSLSGTSRHFWRSPKGTIEKIIKDQTYSDIGGEIQLGINYPKGFYITPIFDLNPFGKYFPGKNNPRLIYQGIDLFSNRSLTNIGNCHVNTGSLPKEENIT